MAYHHSEYASYQRTDCDYLGDIPSDWKIVRLANLFKFSKGYGLSKGELDDAGLYGCILYGELYTKYKNIQTITSCLSHTNSDSGYLSEGDEILIPASTTTTGIDLACAKVLNTGGVRVGGDVIVLKPRVDLDRRFFSHLIESVKVEFARNSKGVTIVHIYQDGIRNIKCPYPSLIEQKNIADFIDRETAKIDELIQRQEKLIELIQEKITSVTDNFVTKGLDKSASLKETKFQTLGKVPSHWDVLQIKKIVSTPVTDGPHETPDFLDDGVPFVSAEAISKGFIDFEKIRGFISPEANKIYSRKYSPQIHDIYMIKSGATTGVTAIVEDRTDFNIWSPLAMIRCSKRMNPYYVLYAMRSNYFQEMVSLSWSFGTQQNIGMGVIENLCIPVPPKEEQDAIVLKIQSALGGLKQLQDKAMRGISLLKEHRASLIIAAITGKIDVRGSV